MSKLEAWESFGKQIGYAVCVGCYQVSPINGEGFFCTQCHEFFCCQVWTVNEPPSECEECSEQSCQACAPKAISLCPHCDLALCNNCTKDHLHS